MAYKLLPGEIKQLKDFIKGRNLQALYKVNAAGDDWAKRKIKLFGSQLIRKGIKKDGFGVKINPRNLYPVDEIIILQPDQFFIDFVKRNGLYKEVLEDALQAYYKEYEKTAILSQKQAYATSNQTAQTAQTKEGKTNDESDTTNVSPNEPAPDNSGV